MPAISPLPPASAMNSVSPVTGCRNWRSTISALARSERIARVRSARIAPVRGTSTIITTTMPSASSPPKIATGRSIAGGPKPALIITTSSLSV